MTHWWEQTFLGNPILDYLIVLATIVIAGFVLYALRKTVLEKLKSWAAKSSHVIYTHTLAGIENSVFPIVFVLVIYSSLRYLVIPPNIMDKVRVLVWIVVMFFILKSVTIGIRHFIAGRIEERTESEARKKQANGLILILNFIIWIIGFVFLLDNLGYNIGTLIAGLGIGGIAIALAAQTILSDLFAYFVIYFDKPFEIGDFIIFDEKAGVVEYIGLKTTRIRTLSGEQLICSNVDLTDARVHNYKRMATRRVVFELSVTHQTPLSLVQEVPGILKNAIEAQENTRFDRAHFMRIAKASLDYEIVYYINGSDYNLYMDIHQAILLMVKKAFENKGIELAYPTQTIYLQPRGVEEVFNDFSAPNKG